MAPPALPARGGTMDDLRSTQGIVTVRRIERHAFRNALQIVEHGREVVGVDVRCREHDLAENMRAILAAAPCQERLQRFDEHAVAHAVRQQMDVCSARLGDDGVEELRHPQSADGRDAFIDRVLRSVGLRWPAVEDRRAVEIEIVGELRRTPGRILKRVVVPMDENKDVAGGRLADLLPQAVDEGLLCQRHDLVEDDEPLLVRGDIHGKGKVRPFRGTRVPPSCAFWVR